MTIFSNQSKLLKPSLFSLLTLALVACSSDNDDPAPPPVQPIPKTFQVVVTNITHSQPFSPAAVALHQSGSFWQLNQAASDALETMAEGGDNSALLAESFVLEGASGGEIIMPGTEDVVPIQTLETGDLYLSVATMLVNTNDAFTGVSSIDVTNMAVGDSLTFRVAAYDAGTEGNSEAQGTIPGPADGGEGFNSTRDDRDFVHRHPGVVTMDDGLMTSVLDQSHRFDNPVSTVRILRTR